MEKCNSQGFHILLEKLKYWGNWSSGTWEAKKSEVGPIWLSKVEEEAVVDKLIPQNVSHKVNSLEVKIFITIL